jgi:hypothetical protein
VRTPNPRPAGSTPATVASSLKRVRVSPNGRASAFQAEDGSSNPLARSRTERARVELNGEAPRYERGIMQVRVLPRVPD